MPDNLIILLADNNEEDVARLKRAFLRIGVNAPVHACTDGQDVLNYLQGAGRYADRSKFPFPRVLITEINLPSRTGFDILTWLQEHPQCNVIPTIVLTTSADRPDVTRAYQLGANCYLKKPGDIEQLSNLVQLAGKFWSHALLPPVPPQC